MTASPALVAELHGHLMSAAAVVPSAPLDHFPPLIIYRCLEGAEAALAAAARSQLEVGAGASSETVSMPRRGYGPRPVEVLSPVSRTAYAALVGSLKSALPEPSRKPNGWRGHRNFGRSGKHTHVVELDFASCYQLIDHEDLRQELLLRSFETATVSALCGQLQGMGRRGRGLPQMLDASDQLADTYLSIIDRHLTRRGYELNRYADDVRVLAYDWDQANLIIEEVAERARSLGLILASAKTGIRLREGLDASEEASVELFTEYVERATDELIDWIEVDFGAYATRLEPLPPEQAEAIRRAYSLMVDDWHEQFVSSRDEHQSLRLREGLNSHINSALVALEDAEDRVADKVLKDLVFSDPTRLEAVCRYALARRERPASSRERTRDLIVYLTKMGRQSAWSKLWILHTIERIRTRWRTTPKAVSEWTLAQLSDSHEVVRSQAAWLLACSGDLTKEHLEAVYSGATEVSAPAVAAAAVRQNQVAKETGSKSLDSKLVEAVRDDGVLNSEAAAWAQ